LATICCPIDEDSIALRKSWEVVPFAEDPKVQFAPYGTPLSKEQLQKLAQKITDSR
jgi:hypothetical protein